MKILIINGPNINMLGVREPEIYGSLTLEELNSFIKEYADEKKIEVDFFVSNIEGEIVSKIQETHNKYDGLVINPGAYTHYSIAILDALKSVNTKSIEVHLSNINKREEYRRKSVTAEATIGQISGFGKYSYILALEYFKNN